MTDLLYKAEKPCIHPSVRPSVCIFCHGVRDLGCLCMDQHETWFVCNCGLWHMNAPLNNFLTVLCWVHERFKHAAVVVFAIIFGHVKF